MHNGVENKEIFPQKPNLEILPTPLKSIVPVQTLVKRIRAVIKMFTQSQSDERHPQEGGDFAV